jgi:hypothetical protein
MSLFAIIIRDDSAAKRLADVKGGLLLLNSPVSKLELIGCLPTRRVLRRRLVDGAQAPKRKWS